jgi:proline utilization trans-activator
MDEATKRNPLKRRRVPPDLRKRAAVSCDLCKTRRRKCVPSGSAGQCNLCKKNKIDCVSTIPRRERFRSSDDTQVRRHRLLETLVQKLFPDIDLDDTNELMKLSDFLDQSDARVQWHKSNLPTGIYEVTYGSEVFLGSMGQRAGVQPPFRLRPASGSDIRYERILKNSSGTLSYFGPSSSMAFVMRLRELLASKTSKEYLSLPPKQRKLQEEFMADRRSCTMEVDLLAKHSGECSAIRSKLKYEGDFSSLRHKRNSHSTAQNLPSILPPKSELEELVELFFTRVHPNLVLFHRPSFQAALEKSLSAVNDDCGCVDVGWVSCICLVVAFGWEWRISGLENKESLETLRITQQKQRLLQLAFSNVSQLILSATLQSVQALTLLSMYLNCSNERNASWVMMGCALRMGIGLGLHREEHLVLNENLRLSPIDRQLRKRVWWSLYIFEQYCSGLSGRPSALREEEIAADLPNESSLDEGYHRPPGLLRHDVCLARIIGKVNVSQNNQRLSQDARMQVPKDTTLIQQLLNELNSWRDNLPSYLSFDGISQAHIYPSHFRQILCLHLRYQHARLTLTRPCHLKKLQQLLSSQEGDTERGIIEPSISYLSDVCVDAALESWKIVNSLWERGEFDGNLWFDGIFVYQSALVLSLTLLDRRAKSNLMGHNELQNIIQNILGILHQAPLNKTMNRLVQISTDFASIVRAMDPQSVQNGAALDNELTGLGNASERCFATLCCHETTRAEEADDLGLSASTDLEPSFGDSVPLENQDEVSDNSGINDFIAAWNFEGAGFLDSLLNGDAQFHAFGV